MKVRDIGEVFTLGSSDFTVEVRRVHPDYPCEDMGPAGKSCIFAMRNSCALKNEFEDGKRYIDITGPCLRGTDEARCFVKALPLIPILKKTNLKCIKNLLPDFKEGEKYKAEILASSKMYKIKLTETDYAYMTTELVREHFTEDETLF